MKAEKKRKRIPKVRLVQPTGRPIQLRYFDPDAGREVRISTGTYDRSEADEQREDLKAKLRLGEKPAPKATKQHGPKMSWETFRDEYRRRKLERPGVRPKGAIAAECRLDVAERILQPRTLGDVAVYAELDRLQGELLRGGGRLPKQPERERSEHTVNSYMRAVVTALRWAKKRGWLESVPEIEHIETAKLRHAKGRPITGEEFDRMLEKVEPTVGAAAAPSWKYLLRGLWASGLRLDEALHVSWDIPGTIRPEWNSGQYPVLCIPASMQKNKTEEAIPLLPWFESVLLETPEQDRTGWVFRPASLQEKCGRKQRHGRPKADWVSKVISRIGEAARVVVHPGDEAKEREPKYASAHDLRRACIERMRDAGWPAHVLTMTCRHADPKTTQRYYLSNDVQKAAAIIRGIQPAPECTQVQRTA